MSYSYQTFTVGQVLTAAQVQQLEDNIRDHEHSVSSVSTLLKTEISPSQITASQNDYNPTSLSTASALRLDLSAAWSLTGLQGGSAGRVLALHNISSYTLTLANESSSSTAANRFALGSDFGLNSGQSVLLRYDGTSSRWRMIGGGGAMVLLAQGTSSSVAQLDFVLSSYSAFRAVTVVLQDLLPATNDVAFKARVSTDGGSSYSSSSYKWSTANPLGGYGEQVAFYQDSDNQSGTMDAFHIASASCPFNNTSSVGGMVVFELHNFSGSYHKHARWTATYRKATSASAGSNSLGGGQWQSTTAVNALRFLFSSGNISNVKYALYGLI